MLHALNVYQTYAVLDSEDALCPHMQAAASREIVNYDRGFDRVEGVVRVEP